MITYNESRKQTSIETWSDNFVEKGSCNKNETKLHNLTKLVECLETKQVLLM